MSSAATHGGSHDHGHHDVGLIRKYVFSVDHKIIGIWYAMTGLLFLLFGFSLMLVMRWQLAYPGEAIPLTTALGAARGGSCSDRIQRRG